MQATSIEEGRVDEEQRAVAVERTRQTMTAYLDALLGEGAFGWFLAEDVTYTVIGGEEAIRGREAVVGVITWLHKQTFAGTPVVKTTFFAESRAAIEADFVGTHVGEFAGIAPTGRPIQVPFSVFYDLAGNAITAIRAYVPMDAIRRQIGAA